MDKIYKLVWAVRLFCYSIFIGSVKFPGYLGKPMYLLGMKRIFLGRRVRFFPMARIEVFPEGRLVIGDNVAVAQSVHITCKRLITIGSGTCIAANVCITDIKHNYNDIEKNILAQTDEMSPTTIGENCFIGFGAVIDAGTTLGKGCIVGANAYLKGEYPAYSVIAAPPAKVIKNYG